VSAIRYPLFCVGVMRVTASNMTVVYTIHHEFSLTAHPMPDRSVEIAEVSDNEAAAAACLYLFTVSVEQDL